MITSRPATRCHVVRDPAAARGCLPRSNPICRQLITRNFGLTSLSMSTNIFPALRYRDADAALDFLKKAFGFEEQAVHRGEDGSIGHAELRLGAGVIMFGGFRADG